MLYKSNAVLIEIDICVTSERNTAYGQYNRITKHMVEDNSNNTQQADPTYLLLGSINKNHFQSLILNHNMGMLLNCPVMETLASIEKKPSILITILLME